MNLEISSEHILTAKNSLGYDTASFYSLLLSVVWATSSRYQFPDDLHAISKELGIDSALAEQHLNKLESAGYIKAELDRSRASEADFIYVVNYLKNIVDENEDVINRDKKQKQHRNRLTGSAISKIKSRSPSPYYNKACISKPDSTKIHFSGWLPTNLYGKKGEAIQLKPTYISLLSQQHPNKDVEFELSKIFDYLMNKPSGRKSYSDMPGFIESWLIKAKETLVSPELEERLKCL